MANPHVDKLMAEYEEGGAKQLLTVAAAALQFSDYRIRELEKALAAIARGRKDCPSGSQRISRDELKTMARDACASLGIRWEL